MSTRLRLLGPVAVELDAGTTERELAAGVHARITVALLAMERRRAIQREEIAECLWPGELPRAWESAVRGAITKARTFFVQAGIGGRGVVAHADGAYRVRFADGIVLDVEEARDAVMRAEEALRAGRPADAAAAADTAADVLGRPFLAGLEGPWIDRVRHELHGARIRALDSLAAASVMLADHVTAVEAAGEVLALEPFHEHAHRQLIAALAASGNKAEALAAYERCRRALAEELGTDPSPETEAVYLRVLRDEAPTGASATGQGASPDAGVPQALHVAARGPFVGREVERAALSAAWERASSGSAVLALVSGEPGIGKTTLASVLAAEVAASGGIVLLGRCDEHLGLTFLPFVEALESFSSVFPYGERPELYGPLAGELTRLVPALATVIGDEPLPAEPETERYRLFEAVAGWLGSASSSQPVLLVLDDLHWASAESLLLLRHAVRPGRDARFLVVGTFRDTDLTSATPLTRALPDLTRLPDVVRVHLTGLPPDEISELVGSAAVSAEELLVATAGNPFYMSELLRHIDEGGTVAGRLPGGIRETISARFARLPSATIDLLVHAAVIGSEFDVAVLAAAASVDEDAAVDMLDAAAAAGLVVDAAHRDRFAFVHALVRSSLYEGITGSRRLRLHLRVARALADRPDADRRTAELAWHYCEAAPLGVSPVAERYAVTAGEDARRHLAFAEAASHFGRALEVGELFGGPDARCDIRIALGEAMSRAGDPAFRDVLLEAAARARDAADDRALAEAALSLNLSGTPSAGGSVDVDVVRVLEEALRRIDNAEGELRARLMATLAVELVFTGDDARRVSLAEGAIELARRLGEGTLCRVVQPCLMALAGPDTAERRRDDAREIIETAERVGDAEAGCAARLGLFDAAIELGDRGEAERVLREAVRMADELRHAYIGWAAAVRSAGLRMLTGDLDPAADMGEAARALGEERGVPALQVMHAWAGQVVALESERGRPVGVGGLTGIDPLTTEPLAAYAAAEEGQLDEARAHAELAIAGGLSAIPRNVLWTARMLLLARTYVKLADVERCGDLYEALAGQRGRMSWLVGMSFGPVDLALGSLAGVAGDRVAAREHLTDARTLCARMEARLWMQRTEDALRAV